MNLSHKPPGEGLTREEAHRAEVEQLRERLAQWEAGLETTNPAQAIAEHRAVLEKRKTLQTCLHQNEVLLERTSNELVQANIENARLKAELDEARKAPERSEEQ